MENKEMLEKIRKDIVESYNWCVADSRNHEKDFRNVATKYLKSVGMEEHIEIKVKISEKDKDMINIELIPLDTTGEKFIKEFKEG